MDLEQLKENWQQLSKRVEKYEILNKQTAMNMLRRNTASTTAKMEKFEFVFFAISVVYTAFLGIMLFVNDQSIVKNESIVVCMAVFVFAGAWQLYKLILLQQMKFDSCTIIELQKKALRYKVVTQTRFVVGMITLIPVLVALAYFQQEMLSREIIFAMVIGAAIGVIIGVRAFMSLWKNINDLITDLRELESYEKL